MAEKQRYFGGFESYDNLLKEFSMAGFDYATHEYQYDPLQLGDNVPTDAEVLFANYGSESYDGSAVVIFIKKGRLYEVEGSHCSCNGLEGSWNPEETTVEALAMRDVNTPYFDAPAQTAFQELVKRLQAARFHQVLFTTTKVV